jgi:hypothetical protein
LDTTHKCSFLNSLYKLKIKAEMFPLIQATGTCVQNSSRGREVPSRAILIL